MRWWIKKRKGWLLAAELVQRTGSGTEPHLQARAGTMRQGGHAVVGTLIDHTRIHMFQRVPTIGIVPHRMDGEGLQRACSSTERF